RLRLSSAPLSPWVIGSPAPMADRWTRLAELAVHGANVQPGQVVLVTAEIGNEEGARAAAAAAYERDAKFVDVDYFDPWGSGRASSTAIPRRSRSCRSGTARSTSHMPRRTVR